MRLKKGDQHSWRKENLNSRNKEWSSDDEEKSSMKYPTLFSPLKIGNCIFPNRIMSTAAVTRLAAEDGHVTEAIKDRYKRLAQGGLGAMVVEAAVVVPSRSSFNLRVSDDQFILELQDFVRSIRRVNPDVKIGLQLIHFLKVARSGWRQKVEDLT